MPTPTIPSKPLPKRPSEATRVAYVFAALMAITLAIGPSDLLSIGWWSSQSVRAHFGLAASGIAGILIGGLAARSIWRLDSKKSPKWKDALIACTAATIFVILIYVRESHAWVWPLAAGDAFFVCLSAVLVFASLTTERRRKVKVYMTARNFVFIGAGSGTRSGRPSGYPTRPPTEPDVPN